jgi:hypothetical protein
MRKFANLTAVVFAFATIALTVDPTLAAPKTIFDGDSYENGSTLHLQRSELLASRKPQLFDLLSAWQGSRMWQRTLYLSVSTGLSIDHRYV